METGAPDESWLEVVEAADGAALSTILGQRMKALRRRQGMTLDDLAAAVAKHGGELSRPVLGKIEVGKRRVTIDEAMLLAYALNCSLLNLILPLDERWIQVGNWKVGSGRVRAWARGDYPALGGIDRRVYDTEVPESEWRPPSPTWRPLTDDPDQAASYAAALRRMADELGGRVVFTDEHGNQLVYPDESDEDES